MKIKFIELDDDENPSAVAVAMTADEALFVAVVLGKQSGTDAEAFMVGGARLSTEVYGCLTGGLFNRFYEDGVDGAKYHYGQS